MAGPSDTTDWQKLARDDLDLGLNNGKAVAGSADIVAGWDRRSAALRARYPDHLDLRYGPRERNRIDLLKAADAAPTLLFIHGGYWQMRAKENFTVVAEGPLAHGINVALIGYTQIGELGGRRKKSTTVAPDINAYWTHQSFHNYADHALSGEFHSGLTRLLELSAVRHCAIMCSETLWWRCHRRIVADYLLHNNRSVFHLMSPARLAPALLTEAATPHGTSLFYPAIINS